MPKRTNAFQKLVLWVRRHATADAITESHFLLDVVTCEPREVDLCVATAVDGKAFLTCIECVGKGRRATVEWVEQMRGKHSDLPTSVLVLASQRGFSRAAKQKASHYGIELLDLRDIATSAATIFAGFERLFLKVVTQRAEYLRVQLALPTGRVWKEQMPADIAVYSKDGVAGGVLGDAAALLATDARVHRALVDRAETKHTWTTLGWNLPENVLFVRNGDTAEAVHTIELVARIEVDAAAFDLKRGLLGGQEVAWGEPTVQGIPRIVVATAGFGGATIVSIDSLASPKVIPRAKRRSRKSPPGSKVVTSSAPPERANKRKRHES